MGALEYETSVISEKQRRASREQRQLQTLQDIGMFRERMLRLADNLMAWLEGHEVTITVREMLPVATAGAYTLPCIVLQCGRNWAGSIPQALYSVKGGIQLKDEVSLAVDNPRRQPRTEKYMLCLPGHLLSTADWAIHRDERTPGKGKVLTRELLMTALAPLFDDACVGLVWSGCSVE